MPLKASEVTVEGAGATQRLSLTLQHEDNRVLSGARDSDESLPSLSADNAAGPPSRRVLVRSPPPPTGSKVVLVTDIAGSPTESVASPPFLPTSRHHSFFMDDLESHPGESDQSPTGADASVVVAKAAPRTDTSGGTRRSTEGVGASLLTTSAGLDEEAAEGGSAHAAGEGDDAVTAAAAAAQSTGDEEVEVKYIRRRKHRHRLIAEAPPFDPRRPQQLNLLTLGPDPELPLYTFKEIPHWQKYNPYIRSGYRAFYNARMCLKSLLGWHNETINVYSHFLTFIAFVVLTVLLYTTVLSKAISAPTMAASKLMYAIFCFGSMLCMLNSSIYHLCNCHAHQRVMTAMGRLDFIGITVLIVASFLPPLYVMFHCYRVLRIVYIASILVLGSAAVIGPWTDVFHEHVGLRVAIFLGLGFSGLVPAVHSVILMPYNAATASVAIGVLLMVGLYCGGVVFYVTQFPESRYPGHFDFWLSSHQIWHFFVSMAALVHYFNCVSMYQMWQISDGICN